MYEPNVNLFRKSLNYTGLERSELDIYSTYHHTEYVIEVETGSGYQTFIFKDLDNFLDTLYLLKHAANQSG